MKHSINYSKLIYVTTPCYCIYRAHSLYFIVCLLPHGEHLKECVILINRVVISLFCYYRIFMLQKGFKELEIHICVCVTPGTFSCTQYILCVQH
jgi:uncharacterized membrane protein